MISVHRLLQASNPVKRWVVLTGMKVVGKYDMLHGLVANPQPNLKCVESEIVAEIILSTVCSAEAEVNGCLCSVCECAVRVES